MPDRSRVVPSTYAMYRWDLLLRTKGKSSAGFWVKLWASSWLKVIKCPTSTSKKYFLSIVF